jgi:hypothetical protein
MSDSMAGGEKGKKKVRTVDLRVFMPSQADFWISWYRRTPAKIASFEDEELHWG